MSVIGKTLKFSGGALLGLGIGAVTALLLAPQSGEESTNQIRVRLNAVLDAGRRAQHQAEDELQARWHATIHEPGKDDEADAKAAQPRKSKAEEAEERAREKADADRREAERHLDKARQELDKARIKL